MARKVSVYYEGWLETGEIIDSNIEDSEPYSFELEKALVFPGFEKAVLSMAVGEEREFLFSPDEAYGSYKEEAVQRSSRSLIENSELLQEGAHIMMKGPETAIPMPGLVTKVIGDFVEVDFNHPLAGKNLKYRIKLVGST